MKGLRHTKYSLERLVQSLGYFPIAYPKNSSKHIRHIHPISFEMINVAIYNNYF